MGLKSFLYSDWATKKRKLLKFWHRNDWAKAHSPSLSQRINNEWKLLRHPERYIIVGGWLLKFYDSKEKYMNWGDDINVYLFEKITGKQVIPLEALLFARLHKNYAFIGSVIPFVLNRKTIVWGSGCIDFERPLSNRPKCVLAVRGPKTRDYLLRYGVDCPKVYGDPALLLPLFYQPANAAKKYKVTIIPHHRDFDEPEKLSRILAQYPDCQLINMTNYQHWTDVIDCICQSELVLSSSLHGLIVADAYGVPNNFCEFAYHHPKYDKYVDYYESIGAEFSPPYSFADIETLLKNKCTARKIVIDKEKLLKAFPLEIKCNKQNYSTKL